MNILAAIKREEKKLERQLKRYNTKAAKKRWAKVKKQAKKAISWHFQWLIPRVTRCWRGNYKNLNESKIANSSL